MVETFTLSGYVGLLFLALGLVGAVVEIVRRLIAVDDEE